MLRGIWVRLVLLVMTVLCGVPATVLMLLAPRWRRTFSFFGRLWSRTMLTACGMRLVTQGLEHMTARSPCIFIANHQSIADIWILFVVMPPETRFVAKQELFRIPIFGWALAASGCIPINRSNRSEAVRSLRLAAERIHSGRSVVLYPEGTRSLDGRLQPFKKGAFHLALQADVPVVPIAITGSFDVVPPTSWRVRPGPVEVHIEPPIDVTQYQPDDHEGLLTEVRQSIRRHFDPPPTSDEAATVRLETP